jgi:hypothetical protein
MSTLSLRKIKHDGSSIDNIALNSDGTTTMNRSLIIDTATTGVPSISLKHANGDADNFIIQAGTPGVTNGGLTIRDIDAEANRLIIDSVGRVTMPYQPAFRATSNGGSTPTLTNNTLLTVVFNATETNVGNHYNTSNGRFTAPVTGFYTFSASLLINQGGANRIDISFTKNGSTWIDYEFRDIGATSTNASVAISTQGMLTVNDYINVRVQLVGANGNIYQEARFWNFSGGLLY